MTDTEQHATDHFFEKVFEPNVGVAKTKASESDIDAILDGRVESVSYTNGEIVGMVGKSKAWTTDMLTKFREGEGDESSIAPSTQNRIRRWTPEAAKELFIWGYNCGSLNMDQLREAIRTILTDCAKADRPLR